MFSIIKNRYYWLAIIIATALGLFVTFSEILFSPGGWITSSFDLTLEFFVAEILAICVIILMTEARRSNDVVSRSANVVPSIAAVAFSILYGLLCFVLLWLFKLIAFFETSLEFVGLMLLLVTIDFGLALSFVSRRNVSKKERFLFWGVALVLACLMLNAYV